MIATTHSLPMEQTLPGRTVPYQVADVRPQVSGILRKRLFAEGQDVTAGQPLYQIDPAPYQAAYDVAKGQLAQAEAAVTAARLQAQRTRTLAAQKMVAQQDADNADATLGQDEAAVVAAKATLQSAKINLDYTCITAPIAGRIGASAYTVGALVSAEQDNALTTIQQLDPIYLDVTESSTQMLALRRQLDAGNVKAIDGKVQVKVLLEDGTPYDQAGALEFVGSTVDAATGNVTLRAIIPNPRHLLLPGMYLRAVLPMATDDGAILVPQQAVTRDPKGNPLVKVLDANNVVSERAVQTGDVIGHDWVVTAGLKQGERIVVLNNSNAAIGSMVEPYPVTEAQLSVGANVPGHSGTGE